MTEPMGTLAWGDARGGRLSWQERWTLTVQGVRAVLSARAAGRRGGALALDPDVSRPTSAVARRAESLLAESSPRWLVHHGGRTFAWALALAARDDLRPDRELLYCASLLHDLGLTAAFLPEPGACFALSGARGAEAALREAGLSQPRARVVAEAIALHLNVVVALDAHGAEAHLLRAATALDVAGQRARAIGAAFRERTLAELPRLEFKREVIGAIEAQARRSPDTRIGFLCRRLSLSARVRDAPFAS